MNILHVNDFHNRSNPGISYAINSIIAQTRPLLEARDTMGLLSVGPLGVEAPQYVRHVNVPLGTKAWSANWRHAPKFVEACDRAILDWNMNTVHIHGAWMHPQFAAAQAAQRAGLPSVLTNHGLFSKWALAQPGRLGALKKRLYLKVMARPLFRTISMYHAITPLDRDSLHALFPLKPIEVIPNAIDLSFVDGQLSSVSSPVADPYVLYIGRLHPSKGIDLLIEAFGRATLPRDWRLLIVGPHEIPAYSARLRQAVADSPRAARIELREPVWEVSEKLALMRRAWVTAVPSYSEVVSLVNLESSACGTPTITTHSTGLFDWQDGGGLLIEPMVESLAEALSQTAGWSEAERHDRGLASRKLVERRYSTHVTGPRWLELYRSL